MDPTQQNAMMLQALQAMGNQPQPAGAGAPSPFEAAMMQAMGSQHQTPSPPVGSQTPPQGQMVPPDPATMTGGLGSAATPPSPPPQGMQGLNGMDPTTAALFSQIPSATGGQ